MTNITYDFEMNGLELTIYEIDRNHKNTLWS